MAVIKSLDSTFVVPHLRAERQIGWRNRKQICLNHRGQKLQNACLRQNMQKKRIYIYEWDSLKSMIYCMFRDVYGMPPLRTLPIENIGFLNAMSAWTIWLCVKKNKANEESCPNCHQHHLFVFIIIIYLSLINQYVIDIFERPSSCKYKAALMRFSLKGYWAYKQYFTISTF